MKTIGDAYNQAYNAQINQGNKFDRLLLESQRINNQKEFQNKRLANQQTMNQIRLAMMQRKLAMMKQNQALRFAQLKMQSDNLAERKREFDLNHNSNTQDFRNQKLKMSGLPFQRETADGKTGLFRMPTGAESTGLEKVIDAYPQLYTAMSQIGQGAKYMQMNSPGDIKKYSSSIISYLSGKATPAQEKILEQSGISLDALTQAAETATRVMNIPKTNEGMMKAFGIFTPRQGDTDESYQKRLENSLNNFSERYWQAQYQLQGIPLADASVGEDQNASLDDMKKFIKSKIGENDIFGKNDGMAASSQSEDLMTNSGKKVSPKIISAYAKQHGMSEAEAAAYIKENM